ncbi:MAG: FAD-dependent oxidoreductase, partial [Actinomycetota bacterium]|nr:FAD-dependent oxidoreductase [Actinomycetota bacterium]
MSTSCDVVVLGAGPAGLLAAWRAARRGFSVEVLDRVDQVGGTSASFEVDGVRVDYGSHRLSAQTPRRVLNDLRDLLGEDLQTRQRASRAHVAGRSLPFPWRRRDLARG